MDRRDFLDLTLRYTALSVPACGLTGCGTVFYSDRVGQPHSRDIDWQVAALNGLGLILFFVPGAIAFAVDFYTGAIYLPEAPAGEGMEYLPASETVIEGQVTSQAAFQKINLDPNSIDQITLEKKVSQRIGKPVRLNETQTRVSQLPQLSEFDKLCENHRQDTQFGFSPRKIFNRHGRLLKQLFRA